MAIAKERLEVCRHLLDVALGAQLIFVDEYRTMIRMLDRRQEALETPNAAQLDQMDLPQDEVTP